jgi:hypothetical protein
MLCRKCKVGMREEKHVAHKVGTKGQPNICHRDHRDHGDHRESE